MRRALRRLRSGLAAAGRWLGVHRGHVARTVQALAGLAVLAVGAERVGGEGWGWLAVGALLVGDLVLEGFVRLWRESR